MRNHRRQADERVVRGSLAMREFRSMTRCRSRSGSACREDGSRRMGITYLLACRLFLDLWLGLVRGWVES